MYCFVDYRISSEESKNLSMLNVDIIKVPKCSNVYEAINGHPDIQLNILKSNDADIIIHKNMDAAFQKTLKTNNIKYIVSKNALSNTYPYDILLNSLILNNSFIHNIKYTDANLLKTQNGKNFISVSQGYTKCSILPVNEKALITSDMGIYKTLRKYDFDVLLVSPHDIVLPHLNYGFIGGTGGMIGSNTMAFFGDLEYYCCGKDILKFLYKYDVKPVYLQKGKLIDRGSILTL